MIEQQRGLAEELAEVLNDLVLEQRVSVGDVLNAAAIAQVAFVPDEHGAMWTAMCQEASAS